MVYVSCTLTLVPLSINIWFMLKFLKVDYLYEKSIIIIRNFIVWCSLKQGPDKIRRKECLLFVGMLTKSMSIMSDAPTPPSRFLR